VIHLRDEINATHRVINSSLLFWPPLPRSLSYRTEDPIGNMPEKPPVRRDGDLKRGVALCESVGLTDTLAKSGKYKSPRQKIPLDGLGGGDSPLFHPSASTFYYTSQALGNVCNLQKVHVSFDPLELAGVAI
jgi:hypothetical protein